MEGTPNSILEASAIGLPIVSTNHAGIMDVVNHGISGFLVNEHEVDTMAKYMQELFENRELAKKMGQEGKNIINTSFTEEKYINTINSLIYSKI